MHLSKKETPAVMGNRCSAVTPVLDAGWVFTGVEVGEARVCQVGCFSFLTLCFGSGKNEKKKKLDGVLWSNTAATLHDENKAKC